MFTTSSQKRKWLFPSKGTLTEMRSSSNAAVVARVTEAGCEPMSDQDTEDLCQHFEYILQDLCAQIERMTHSVVATALLYFKRFYLQNSVMEYHPRDIMLTCIFLACKVDEFYVPVSQLGEVAARHFSKTNPQDLREQYSEPESIGRIVIGLEAIVMNRLGYDLLVHTPWRPLEGLLIDLKARCPEVKDVERLRSEAEKLIDRSYTTDACFLFSPSQIALSAVIHSASKTRQSLDQYVKNTLLGADNSDQLQHIVSYIKAVRQLDRSIRALDKRRMEQLELDLESYRNQANNPLSQEWQKKQIEEFAEEEEDRIERKRQQVKSQLSRMARN